MTKSRLRGFAWWAVAATLAVGLVFGYRMTDRRWCSQCWTCVERVQYGIAVTPDTRLPPWRGTLSDPGPEPGIARFLAPGHVHDADGPGRRSHQNGPFVGLVQIGCGFSMPSEFALRLAGDPPFSDFVAARIADGTTGADTVRRLIAVPAERDREDWEAVAANEELMRRGSDLYAAYPHAGAEPLWIQRTPPGPGCATKGGK